MCFFCGCMGESKFQSVKVILPSEVKDAPESKKRESPSKQTKK